MADKWIYWLNELRSEDNDKVGKKCANLGEMTHLGMKVPPGFAISVNGYELFMKKTGAEAEIKKYVQNNESEFQKIDKQVEASRYIRELIEHKVIPDEMREELFGNYKKLCDLVGIENLAVAVRSSGAISMPGQMETYLNVRGEDDVVKSVVKVWASAFTTRAIAFRLENKMEMHRAPIGVAVLKMVNAKSAGVTLTVQPTTGDLSKVVVEGNWGLGESVVSGEITPDNFIIDKNSGEIESTISEKTKMVTFQENGTGAVDVPEALRNESCLERDELEEIVRIALKVETHYGMPQDMEWVFDKDLTFPDNLFWVQTRPAKYVKKKESNTEYIADLMSRVFTR
ncbi:MAG: PEP/pyruvate-binding domain-containing protein [Deltaproteobacteria bacterium]|nr:PEP/pyruvate-binding domain-containing protein [Deltaproteobacteria bacterium]